MIKYFCDECNNEYTSPLSDFMIHMSCQVSNRTQNHRSIRKPGENLCENCMVKWYKKFNDFCDSIGMGDQNGVPIVRNKDDH